MIYAPDHHLADKAGYVAEHRLVMEKMLGHPLQPGDHVFHLNRDKSDNQPENLTLNPQSKYRSGIEPDDSGPDTKPFALSACGPEAGPKSPRADRLRPTIIYQVLSRAETRFLSRFWSQVDRNGPGGCWLWTGNKGTFGYGIAKIGGIQFRAHRYSYEAYHGSIPEGDWVIRHTCDVPACVNPAHLVIGTRLDNARDRDRRGRNGLTGEKSPGSKLTEEQVREIRREWTGAFGQPKEMARKYGVKASTLYAIVQGKTWKHVK
jgi:hypothetical protein